MVRSLSYSQLLAGSLAATLFVGCHSWSGGAYPFQSTSRVPPPATGSYQVPSSYYNNTGGNVSQVYQGSAPVAANPASAANGSLPAENGFTNTVQPAGYSATAGGMPPVTAAPAGFSSGANAGFGAPATANASGFTYSATPSAPPPIGAPAVGNPVANSPPAVGNPSVPASTASFSDSGDVPSLQWQP